jgi:ABC-type transport system substrate-binding protein
MWAEAGVKAAVKVLDTNTAFTPNVTFGKGNFDGIGFSSGNVAPSSSEYLWRRFNSQGSTVGGFDPDGQDPNRGDPRIDELTNKMRLEFDIKKRMELVYELQRYLAMRMYELTYGGEHPGYSLTWPAVRNVGVFRAGSFGGAPVEVSPNLWIDPTRAPLGQG